MFVFNFLGLCGFFGAQISGFFADCSLASDTSWCGGLYFIVVLTWCRCLLKCQYLGAVKALPFKATTLVAGISVFR